MLLLMALRTPIAIAMFCAGSLGYVAQAGWAPFANFLNAQAFARFASYDLSVIPLFILMGNFASQGGISKSLFEFASSVMARFRGGLAMAAVLASGAFGAICGSSVATAATITSVALPEMRRHGYSGAWPPARSPQAARSASSSRLRCRSSSTRSSPSRTSPSCSRRRWCPASSR
jgi:TRAP-type mannitol/chloroaromatic compound transport system permease large subunit